MPHRGETERKRERAKKHRDTETGGRREESEQVVNEHSRVQESMTHRIERYTQADTCTLGERVNCAAKKAIDRAEV